MVWYCGQIGRIIQYKNISKGFYVREKKGKEKSDKRKDGYNQSIFKVNFIRVNSIILFKVSK